MSATTPLPTTPLPTAPLPTTPIPTAPLPTALIPPDLSLETALALRGVVGARYSGRKVLVVGARKHAEALKVLFNPMAPGVSLTLVDDLCGIEKKLENAGYVVHTVSDTPSTTPPPPPAGPGSRALLDKVLDLAGDEDFVLVHDEPGRRVLVPDGPYRVFHVADKRFASNLLFDYTDVIRGDVIRGGGVVRRRAQAVHAVDGPFAALADALGAAVHVHAYAGQVGRVRYRHAQVVSQPPVRARYGVHLVPRDDFGLALREAFHHFAALQDIMRPTRQSWYPCGSYLMGPGSMDYEPSMHAKQKLLFLHAKNKRHVLEIGVHGGHSLLLTLLASPGCRVTCVDLCAWDHTAQCVAYLQAQFPGQITLLKADSRVALPMIQDSYDLIHVDGDHSYEGAKFDMEQALRLSHDDTVFVIDDYCNGIQQAVTDLGCFDIVSVPSCSWNNCVAKRRSAAAAATTPTPAAA